MRELVHQSDLRGEGEHRIEVELGEGDPAMGVLAPRHLGKPGGEGGRGRTADVARARAYFAEACRRGNPTACAERARLERGS